MLLTGQLNRRIIIEIGTPGKNSVGGPVITWSEYISPYSKVYVSSGDTRFTPEGQIMIYPTVFEINYNSKTKILNNKYRINYNGNYYKIIQIQEIGFKEGFKITTVGFNEDGQPES